MPDEPRDRLLSVLMSGIHNLPSNFWVFVTSRLENDIIVYMEKFINRDSTAKIQMMADIKGTEEDIERFVVRKMSREGGGLGILENSQCRILARGCACLSQRARTVAVDLQLRLTQWKGVALGSGRQSI
ncbi:hypothetical protein BDP27DRAFT_1304734 [Rhodocollybia butyracea]|uniref:Uncharacterized protein n=1 Tax=Rhodocollybia butyracea TaxID=206335 RepID=A0A9P5TWZ6_9AGAR|nr:hypothetical protein BDP27DRAFT_1304734 [Rhodocollybia butyracea]